MIDSTDKHVESLQRSMGDVAAAIREGNVIVEKADCNIEKRTPTSTIR